MFSTTVVVAIAVLFVTPLVAALFIGREMFGQRVAVRQTMWLAVGLVCVLLFMGVLYLFVPETWEEPLWSGLQVGFVLLLWGVIGRSVLGRRRAGPVLLDLGRTRGYQFMLVAGGLYFFTMLVNVFINVLNNDAVIERGAELLFRISIGCYFTFLGLTRVQLRERAFVHQQSIIPWNKIRGYRWETDRLGTLTLKVDTWWLFTSELTLSIPFEHDDAMNTILAQRVSAAAPSHERDA